MSDRDQLLFDLFVTAMEGGIGYWSQASAYHWGDGDGVEDMKGFYAVIRDDDGVEHRVDRSTMAKGYGHATSSWRNRIAWSSGQRPPVVPGEWDYDAGDADVVLQLGLFDEVVYG